MYSDYVVETSTPASPLPKKIAFSKMHGLGNDFVIIDQRYEQVALTPDMVRFICNRHFGVGCDQLIILRPSEEFDCQMLIFNQDGSIARACGNACRCVAKLLDQPKISLQIHDRVVIVERQPHEIYQVNMGRPATNWYEIPLRENKNVMNIEFTGPYVKLGACVNVGNPHLVFVEKELDPAKCRLEGEYFEKHPLFPDRVNVSFAKVLERNLVELYVWERGAGHTHACGSAACATHFILHKKGLIDTTATIQQAGGDLYLTLNAAGEILIAGAASFIFQGELIA